MSHRPTARVECLVCGCPCPVSLLREGVEWTCPNCGGGFVRFVLTYEVQP